jgi:hypothetical protein
MVSAHTSRAPLGTKKEEGMKAVEKMMAGLRK